MGSLAALFGFLAVFAGALGAHLLGSRLDAKHLAWFDTANRILMFQALALMGLVLHMRGQRLRPLILRWIGLAFAFGTALFCGSLFALALGAPRWIAHLAPIGGLLLMAGWLLWAWAWKRLP